jgi:hypothetical protein
MPITPQDLEGLKPDKLSFLSEQLKLIGYVLGHLALIDVVVDADAPATAKAQAGRTLTQVGEDPQTIVDRLKESQFADKSPEELREYIRSMRDDDSLLDQLLEEEE